MLLRFLFGAFQAGTFPSISRMMADWMPTTERGSAQGTIWMSSRVGGALAPILLVWLFAVIGDWKTPLVLVALLGLAWGACFWPWFRNLPEETPRVNREERRLIESGRSPRAGAGHGEIPWARMLQYEKRLGLVPDVRFPGLQRQLLPHALADVFEKPSASQLGRHGSTHVVTLRRGGRGVFRGRFVLRCGDPSLGKAMGPSHCRRGRHDVWRVWRFWPFRGSTTWWLWAFCWRWRFVATIWRWPPPGRRPPTLANAIPARSPGR